MHAGLSALPLSPAVFAHAFGARYELPIPLPVFVLGGAAAVAVSFFVVLRTKVEQSTVSPVDVTHVRPVGTLAGLVGLTVVGLLCWAGIVGSQALAENIVTSLFWIYLWVVVPLLCGLFGDFTSAFNPFGYLAQLGDSDRLRRWLLGSPEPVGWPSWLGWWPAVVLAVTGTLFELVYNATTTLPRFLGYMLLVYALVSAVMGMLFGARAWRERGELFSVLFATWGRIGWFRFGAPGRRGMLGGLEVPFERSVSRSSFVITMLAAISFDGILSTHQWGNFESRTFPLGDTFARNNVRDLSLLILILVLYGVFTVFAVGVRLAGGRTRKVGETLSGLLPSMVPIAFGYLFAHYLQYVLINGQLLLTQLSRPSGGRGLNLHLPYPFNDSYEIHQHFLPNAFYWYVDVAVIVVVHIAAVVLAHRQLARTGRTPTLARRAEYPWIVAMVGYTMLSLWLLAQPLTKEKTTTRPAGALRPPASAVLWSRR